jgi:hypothetical protein
LDHVNLTFIGVVALFAGVVILALGGPLHWLLEPSSEPEDGAMDRTGDNASNPRST